MCGIAGIIGQSLEKRELIKKFLLTNNHRGPDSRGEYSDDYISLGMNRLSIIDLENGDQPLTSEDGRYNLIFNGEIYNYKEIRNRLRDKYNFFTNTDTEVILRGFQEYGIKIFSLLNGIFAIAIWDNKNNELILVRDQLGIKPLYYGIKNNNLFFSSELKTFTNNNIFNDANLIAISQSLLSGYVFCPNTSLKNVHQLKPGELFIINNNLEIKKINFKNIKYENRNNLKVENIEEYVFENLKQAVKRQSVSDVPIGLLLSSGIDSMSILSCLKELGNINNLKTFTAYYPNDSYSENKPVEKLAKEWGFNNSSVLITPEIVYENLDDIFYTFDNLDFIPVCVSKYIVSKLASEEMKVLYAGAGGDEIFLGYPTHIATVLNNRFNFNEKIFHFLKKFIFLKKDNNKSLDIFEKIERFIIGSSYNKNISHLFWRHIFTIEELNNFKYFKDLNVDIFEIFENQINIMNSHKSRLKDYKNIMSAVDMETWLVDHALKLWDKAGMSNSVEIRVPFLDIEFLNNIFMLSSNQRINKIGSKQILRNGLNNFVSKSITSLPKKGFTVPTGDWLRNKKINKLFKELTFSLDTNLVDHEYLENIWKNFDNKRGNFAWRLWILGCLGGWIDKHKIKFN